MPARLVLALDVGGTKLAAGLVDPDGSVRTAVRAPTPPEADAETLFAALSLLAERAGAVTPDGLAGVGIGCGGPMSWPAGVVSPLNLPGWRDFPLRARLADRYAAVPVRLHNDAVCLAVAEHWLGAGRGVDALLGMVVSTGVGGGLVLGGRLIDGPSGNAGHVGHVIVDPAGPACACGGRGCLEAVARGPAVLAWAVEHGWRPSAADPGGQRPPDGQLLAEAARAGDEVARAAFTRAGRAIGVALASATALADLQVVAVGGGLARAGELLFEPLRAAIAEHARLEFARAVRVLPARLGPNAGLVGAAALVHAGDRYWSAD